MPIITKYSSVMVALFILDKRSNINDSIGIKNKKYNEIIKFHTSHKIIYHEKI